MSLKSTKQISLGEICKVVDTLGNLTETTFDSHSLGLIITQSGEAAFTRSGSKLLLEAGFCSPLAKIVINCVKKYTDSCGEDCKCFLFILKEMLNAIHNKIDGNEEASMRIKFIQELTSLKRILPCIFNSIRSISDIYETPLNSSSFSKDLHCVVNAFMKSRFSVNVSKQLGDLICNFILSIRHENKSLRISLGYITVHFDLFCSKILLPLTESQLLKGFIFCRKAIPSVVTLDDGKFVIIWDLSLKAVTSNISLKISTELFVQKLNHNHMYQKVFTYFKERNIKLILTPSPCDKDIKLMCEKNKIILLDRLDRNEVENILSGIHLSPLENLNETLEIKHIGDLEHFNLVSYNKSHFVNIVCSNSPTFFNAHHILLCAPFESLWKEYYSECLNCLKMVQQWLSPNSNLCSFQSNYVTEKHMYSPQQSFSAMDSSRAIKKNVESSHEQLVNITLSSESVIEENVKSHDLIAGIFSSDSGIESTVNSSLEQPVNIACFFKSTPDRLNKISQQSVNMSHSNSAVRESVNPASQQLHNKVCSVNSYSVIEENLKAHPQLKLLASELILERNVNATQRLNGQVISDIFQPHIDAENYFVESNIDKPSTELHQNKKSDVPSQLCDANVKINRDLQSSAIKLICNTCSQLEINLKSNLQLFQTPDVGFAFYPGLWEVSFLTSLERVSVNSNLSCRNVVQILHFIFIKMVCMRVGVPFSSVKDLQSTCAAFYEICNRDKNLLEPVICKEILIYSVLDLIVQLLKIDGIVCIK